MERQKGFLDDLSKPFDPGDIEWFIGVTTQDKTKGLAIPFITNRAVQDRLDEVCGVDGWKNEYKHLKDTEKFDREGTITGKQSSYLCGISVWSEKRQEWVTKWDGSDETDIEALKGGLSSAMKRAAVNFGIGRYLYKLDNPWVEIEKRGNSYVMKPSQHLILPSWAMPGGRGFPLGDESRQVRVQTGPTPVQNQPQPTQQQQNQPTGGHRALTEKQIDRAKKKALAANQNWDDVILWIQKKFGVADITHLDRQQYDALCDALDNARK